MTNDSSGHPETCGTWAYSLLKDGDVIDNDDYIPSLAFPNDNIRFKILDFYGFQNHQDTKEYKKWIKKERK